MAAVRSEPRDTAERATELLRGEPFTVERDEGAWLRIRTVYDYPGWVRAAEVLPHAADPIHEARAFAGAPYLWGGLTERGIDCSGLVHIAYRRCGVIVPRDAHEQEDAGQPVPEDDVRPGDLVTYGEEDGRDDGGRATHIAFWLGNGRILHSTQRDGVDGVIEEDEPAELRVRRRVFVRLETGHHRKPN